MTTYTSELEIHAPPRRVFDALTQPELMARWQFGRELTTTWEVGSEIRFRTPGGIGTSVLEQWGTILEVRPDQTVKYNLFTPRADSKDTPENRCITTYELTSDGARTRVKLTQEDFRLNAFAPTSLDRILVALKEVAESA